MHKDKLNTFPKVLDRAQKQENILQLKLKQQIKANIFILISIIIMSIVAGMTLAFLK